MKVILDIHKLDAYYGSKDVLIGQKIKNIIIDYRSGEWIGCNCDLVTKSIKISNALGKLNNLSFFKIKIGDIK